MDSLLEECNVEKYRALIAQSACLMLLLLKIITNKCRFKNCNVDTFSILDGLDSNNYLYRIDT